MSERPDSAGLQAAGAAAFRQGRYAEARRLFGIARSSLPAGDPRATTLLSDYGAACAALGDHAAACEAHKAALAARRAAFGDAHPEVGASLHNLGASLRALGDTTAAETCHRQAADIWAASLGPSHPLVAKPISALAALARDRGDTAAALGLAARALRIRRENLPPDDPQIGLAMEEQGKAHSAAGDDQAALASWNAALAILRPHVAGSRLAPLLNNCGVAARALADLAGAQNWFQQALAADPGLTPARHNLASVLAGLGDTEAAARQRDIALRETCVFVQGAARPRQSVLIPSLAGDGNVPLEHILPERDFTRIWWFLAHGHGETGAGLPPYGVVFNGIGDPDMAGHAAESLRTFMSSHPATRLLNHPDAVARTRRDRLAQTFEGIGGIIVPRTCRVTSPKDPADLMRQAAEAGNAPPLLLRPAGAHGGKGVIRIKSRQDLEAASLHSAEAWYVSRYHDCRGPDGFFRKYRIAFVDRKAFPYHLAISPTWLVHYHSADMADHAWKRAEEAAFLAAPDAVLGGAAWRALALIGARLDLDFCGIDFTLHPTGEVLIFEANATMLIHPEPPTGELAFKNPYVRQITDAVSKMIQSDAQRTPSDPGIFGAAIIHSPTETSCEPAGAHQSAKQRLADR